MDFAEIDAFYANQIAPKAVAPKIAPAPPATIIPSPAKVEIPAPATIAPTKPKYKDYFDELDAAFAEKMSLPATPPAKPKHKDYFDELDAAFAEKIKGEIAAPATIAPAPIEDEIADFVNVSPPPIKNPHQQWITDLAATMERYVHAGNRVILLCNRDGDRKRPYRAGWADADALNASMDILKFDLRNAAVEGVEITGFGVVQGAVSKNSYTLDFDDGRYFHLLRDKLAADGIDIGQLPRLRSGRTEEAYHVTFCTTEPMPTTILARRQQDGRLKSVIEGKGDGAQVVREGSRHQSGRLYTVEVGDMANPPMLPDATVAAILSAARSYDETQAAAPVPPRAPRQTTYEGGEDKPIDKYNAENGIEDILERYGYTHSGGDFWRHPNNGQSEKSVHVFPESNIAHHFSGNDPAHAFWFPAATGGTTTPFNHYCHHEHGGNVSMAVRALAMQYGMYREPTPHIDPSAGWETLGIAATAPTAAPVKMEAAITEATIAKRPPMGVDLTRFPTTLGKAIAALCKQNTALDMQCHLTPVFAVIGSMIGKRMHCHNLGQEYYPNLWTVIPAPTGTNKSGSRNIIQQAIKDINILMPNKPTSASLFLELGKSINKKEWGDADYDEKARLKKTIRDNCENNLNGRIFLSDECTGTLDRLKGGWNSKSSNSDIEDVLNLSDPTVDFENTTRGDGFAAMYDLCISFIGFTQESKWQESYASQSLKDIGLFGRFIYGTNKVELQNMPAAPEESFKEIMGRIRHEAECIDYRVECTFGPADQDFIKDAMAEIETRPASLYFKQVYPNDWSNLRGKVIGQAIRLAMICAFMDGKTGTPINFGPKPTHIDCFDYFTRCAEMAVTCFLAYLDSEDCRKDNVLERKVLSELTKHGYLLHSHIANATRLYGAALNSVITSLGSKGKIGVYTRQKDKETYSAIIKEMGWKHNCCADIYYKIK